MTCPCGSSQDYERCCGRFHNGSEHPATAQDLMRSRYCAFVKSEIAYLRETYWPKFQPSFDETGYAARAKKSLWLGLDILNTEAGLADDTKGTVTFVAKSMINGQVDQQREKSLFKKKAGRWYYVEALKE